MAQHGDGVLIWGGGGHGKVVADLVRACGYTVLGFIDADPARIGRVLEPGGARGLVLQSEFLPSLVGDMVRSEPPVALAIGNNSDRLVCHAYLRERCIAAMCHPRATVSPSAVVGKGSVVLPGAVVNAAARIGQAVIVNTAAIVEHDCVLGDAVHVSPGAVLGGGVRVGQRSWVGAGAAVIPAISIGSDATIGAGAVIIRDVPDGATVVGNPGRIIRERPR